MDASEIRRIEAGRRDPGVRVLARLATGLQVTPSELLSENALRRHRADS
jgi:transcriptional regulator with XRE-family HTH domain